MNAVCRFWVFLALVAALAACGSDSTTTPSESQPAAVHTVPVQSARVAAQTRAVGVLAPRDEIRLAFKVGGVVDAVHVESGDTVRKGQALAELKQAEVNATVSQATEGVEKARRDLERARRLRADEVATEEQVENLTTAYNLARSGLEATRFNASFARIEAPVDGIVFERTVEAGELVQPGQTIVVLGSTTSGWVVRVGLADRDLVRLAAGASAEVTFDAFPERTFAGKVTRISAAADRTNGTFEVDVEVAPTGARFVRGLVAKVKLPLAPLPGAAATAMVIPVAALVEADGKRATVYVLDRATNVARRKDVSLGALVGESIVITDGLALGESVITDGAAWLTDGRSVRVVATKDDDGQG